MNKIPIFTLSTPTLPIFRRCQSVVTASSSKILHNATSNVFPVHRIYCVGRNYREHAIEMGGDPDKEPPFFFMKPNDAIVDTTESVSIPYPSGTNNLHYEGELVVAIGKDMPLYSNNTTSDQFKDIAQEHIYGYAIGCDLTRRDLQSIAKKTSKPWDASKGFDYSAPCGPIIPKEDITLHGNTKLCLYVNNTIRQETTLDTMIWNIPDILYYLSKLFHLKAGDLIMTGM